MGKYGMWDWVYEEKKFRTAYYGLLWHFKCQLTLVGAMKYEKVYDQLFGTSASGVGVRVKNLAHPSCNSLRQNFFVF